jgi:inosine/xanthosine triphosphatase
MKQLIISSHNPVKMEAALRGFQDMFATEEFCIEGIQVESGVSDQPLTDRETFQGAWTRALNARLSRPDADYWVGIEGGVEENQGEFEVFAWIVILSPSQIGKSRTGTFFLPDQLAQLIRCGKELGDADDIIFKRENSKQGNGAIGLLSGNVIDRETYYRHAIILALVPFKNPNLYPSG